MKRLIDILAFNGLFTGLWCLAAICLPRYLDRSLESAGLLTHMSLHPAVLLAMQGFFLLYYLMYWLGASVSKPGLRRGYLAFGWSEEQKKAWDAASKA